MLYPNLVSIVTYIWTVLGNWCGILLAIDGAVALLERYFGDWVEQKLNKKIEAPKGTWLTIAILVLLLAQGLAYRDIARESKTVIEENTQLKSRIREFENAPKSLPNVIKSPEVISSFVAEARINCMLIDPTSLPMDVVQHWEAKTNISGPMGKIFLRPLGGIQHHRTDEEGMAYTIQRYELPDDSALIGQSISDLGKYHTLHFVFNGISGHTFKECRAAEITLHLNGKEVERHSETFSKPIPSDWPSMFMDFAMKPKLH